MGFLGFANVYAMRVNLSVAIVAMVNNTAIASNSSIIDNSTCPVAANSTEGPPPDGPFAWGAKEQGWILGAFFFGYVVTQLPGGRLAEKYGGKRLYGGGILITSIFTLLTPLAATISLPLFVIVRVIEGFGEGVTFPVMHALLAQWIPPNERSRMAGIVYSGAQAGTVLSLPISGFLCEAFGWPSVFYVFGLLGLVWWVGWCYLVYDSPQTHPRISSSERRYILNSLASSKSCSSTMPVPWRKVFSSGPVWALVVVHVAQNYGFYTLLTELPTYMHNVLHFNMKSNAMLSALPYLAMLVVSLFATRLADYAITSGFDRTLVRKFFNSVGVYLPAVFIEAAGYSGCDSVLVIFFLSCRRSQWCPVCRIHVRPPRHGLQLRGHVAWDHQLRCQHDGRRCSCCGRISHSGPQRCSTLASGVLCGRPGLHRGQHHLPSLGQRQGAELEQREWCCWWTK